MVGSSDGDLNGPSPSMSIVPAKKFRKGTPKSRNGCITCKIRRIKCDEGKPACLKCTNTGRKCDGYVTKNAQSKIRRSRAPQFSFNNPFLDFSGTKREHRFLTFFYHHTAPVISGSFDFDFWNELIPQVSQHEPTIQHAMIAVAVVHARLELVDELFDSVDKLEESRRFELGQYNKAIHHLREHISANGAIGEVTLMSCVLLICLEFLRGGIEQAILHLQGGITILNIYHNNANLKTAKNSARVYSSSGAIGRKLEGIFYRLRIQWTLCGRSATSLDEIEISSDLLKFNEPFSSLQEARTSLDYLNCLLLRFINFNIKCLYSPSSAKDDHNSKITLSVMQGRLCARYENWSKAFESFVAQRTAKADTKFVNGSTLLRIFYLTGTIWLSACVSLKETTFDDKIEEFSSVIALASSLIGDINSCTGSLPGSSTKRSFSFTFEIGVIAPLYFTAISCRNGKIRREALSLLSSSIPRREGPWDAGILQYAARRVVEIEEAGLDDFIASSADPVTARETFMPDDQDRVVDVTIRHKHDIQNKGRKGSSIIYMMKPVDGSKDWIFRQEDVVQDVDLTYRKVGESTFTRSLESATDWATAAFEVG